MYRHVQLKVYSILRVLYWFSSYPMWVWGKKTYAMLLIGFVEVLGCSVVPYNSQEITITFSSYTDDFYKYIDVSQRVLYFTGPDKTIQSENVSIYDEIKIFVYKNGAAPIVSCMVLDKSLPPTIFDECFFAEGATYPYDSLGNVVRSVQLRRGISAEIARVLLVLTTKGASLLMFNIKKLYNTIEKRVPNAIFDKDLLYSAIQNSSLSIYSIRPSKLFKVVVPQNNAIVSNTCMPTDVRIKDLLYKNNNSLYLPYGKWYFLCIQKHTYFSIVVDKNGNYMVLN